MKLLVTGTAGFIGFHIALRLLSRGDEVVGIDNLNPYYDVSLKEARLAELKRHSRFRFLKRDIADRSSMEVFFGEEHFDRVIHMAAQAGVRYSLTNPHAYVESNLVGFVNILEGCRKIKVPHLVYASSSSVYGLNTQMPFSVHHGADHPISLYGATKRANELMAHAYSHLYDLPTTGLRFFTVYGPWGRPDMVLFKFTAAILEGKPIELYNEGKMERDFTYIDDAVEGVLRLTEKVPGADPSWTPQKPDPSGSPAPFRLYNIGNKNPVGLLDLVRILEKTLGKKAKILLGPMQPGDVQKTAADVTSLVCETGFSPSTDITQGIQHFVEWYRGTWQRAIRA